MSTIIQPTGFGTFKEWADAMSYLVFQADAQFPKYEEGEDWRDWAMVVVGGQDVLGQDSPDPFQFDDWREWAERFFSTQF